MSGRVAAVKVNVTRSPGLHARKRSFTDMIFRVTSRVEPAPWGGSDVQRQATKSWSQVPIARSEVRSSNARAGDTGSTTSVTMRWGETSQNSRSQASTGNHMGAP